MNTADLPEANSETPMAQSRRSAGARLDMANPSTVRSAFNFRGESRELMQNDSSEISLATPYSTKGDQSWQDGSTGGEVSNQAGWSHDAASQIAGLNVANLEHRMELTLIHIDQELNELIDELNEVFGQNEGALGKPGDTSGGGTGATTGSTGSSDNTGGATGSAGSSDNTGGATGSTGSSDKTGGATGSTGSSDKTGGATGSTGSSDKTGGATGSTGSSDNTGGATGSTSGSDGAAAKPTSSDPFIANLQFSDPLLSKTVIDAQKTMSTAGFDKLESQLDETYTGGDNNFNGSKNFYSGNPNFNAKLMSSALKNDGLSSSDQKALTGVLASDMPAALASDQLLASVQPTDSELAKTLTDASTALSKSDYSTLEGYIQQFYTGDPNGTGALPDQTYLDSVMMEHAVDGLSTAGQKTMDGILENTLPSAVASDTLAATLQQSDPTLANVLSSAKGALTASGYTDVENYIEQNSTWNQANDASLMHQALSQSGLTAADQSALSNVLSTQMSDALTAAPSSDVLQEMDEAKERYMNDYALEGTNVGDIAGNPGKTGSGWTDSDQVPSAVTKELPWSAIAPLDENNYNKNATVQVKDGAVYLHKKTGGWVEMPAETYWEAVYQNSNNAASAGNGTTNSDGSYQFSAPAPGTNIQMGMSGNSFDPSLYDGVYETMQAKTDVANSGLGINLSGDYFISTPGQVRPGAGESNWVPLTDSYQPLYFTTLSAAEFEADPPPGM